MQLRTFYIYNCILRKIKPVTSNSKTVCRESKITTRYAEYRESVQLLQVHDDLELIRSGQFQELFCLGFMKILKLF